MNLKEFRKEYPIFDDATDDSLADAIHSSYYPDMDKAEFYKRIQHTPSVVVDASSEEEERPSFNPLRNVGKNAAGIAKGLVDFADAGGDFLADKTGANPQIVINSEFPYVRLKSEQEAKDIGAVDAFETASDYLGEKDFGYKAINTTDKIYEADGAINKLSAGAKFVAEQAPSALVDLAALALSTPVYAVARAGQMGAARAENNNKELEFSDILEAAPAVAGSIALDRIGLGKIKKGNVIKAAGAEAATEAIQEGAIEYAGEAAFTEKGMNLEDAKNRALGGALVGGTVGAGVGAGASVANKFSNNKKPEVYTQEELEQADTSALVARELINDIDSGESSNEIENEVEKLDDIQNGVGLKELNSGALNTDTSNKNVSQGGILLSDKPDVQVKDSPQLLGVDGNPINYSNESSNELQAKPDELVEQTREEESKISGETNILNSSETSLPMPNNPPDNKTYERYKAGDDVKLDIGMGKSISINDKQKIADKARFNFHFKKLFGRAPVIKDVIGTKGSTAGYYVSGSEDGYKDNHINGKQGLIVSKDNNSGTIIHEGSHYGEQKLFKGFFDDVLKKDKAIADEIKTADYFSNRDNESVAISEGFAEFSRGYFENYNYVKKALPKVTEAFEKWQLSNLSAKKRRHIKELQAISHTKAWQSAEKDALSIGDNFTTKEKAQKVLGKFGSSLSDSVFDYFQFDSPVRNMVKDGVTTERVFRKMRLSVTNSQVIAKAVASHGAIKFNENGENTAKYENIDEAPTIHKLINTFHNLTEVESKRVNAFLYNQEAVKDIKNGATGYDARKIANDFDTIIETMTPKEWAAIKEIESQVEGLNADLKEMLIESGEYTAKEVDSIFRGNDHMSINYNLDDRTHGKSGGVLGSYTSDSGAKGLAKRKGSKETPELMVRSFVESHLKLIDRAQKASAKNYMLKNMNGVDRAKYVVDLDLKSIDLSGIRNLNDLNKMLENGELKSVLSKNLPEGQQLDAAVSDLHKHLSSVLGFARQDIKNPNIGMMDSYVVNGERHFFTYTDPMLKDMMEFAAASGNTNPKGLAKAARIARQTIQNAITLDPSTAIGLFIKDLLQGQVDVTRPSKEYKKGFLESFKSGLLTPPDFTILPKSAFDSSRSVANVYTIDMVNALLNGAPIDRNFVDYSNNILREAEKTQTSKTKKSMINFVEGLGKAVSVLENTPRIMAMKRSEKDGGDYLEQAAAAAETSTNLQVAGAKLNDERVLSELSLFMRASLSGMEKMARQVSDIDNLGFLTAKMARMSVATGAIVYLMGAGDDDEVKEKYGVALGDDFNLPKTYGSGGVGQTIGQEVAQYLTGAENGEQVASDILTDIMKNFDVDFLSVMKTGSAFENNRNFFGGNFYQSYNDGAKNTDSEYSLLRKDGSEVYSVLNSSAGDVATVLQQTGLLKNVDYEIRKHFWQNHKNEDGLTKQDLHGDLPEVDLNSSKGVLKKIVNKFYKEGKNSFTIRNRWYEINNETIEATNSYIKKEKIKPTEGIKELKGLAKIMRARLKKHYKIRDSIKYGDFVMPNGEKALKWQDKIFHLERVENEFWGDEKQKQLIAKIEKTLISDKNIILTDAQKKRHK